MKHFSVLIRTATGLVRFDLEAPASDAAAECALDMHADAGGAETDPVERVVELPDPRSNSIVL